MSTVDLKHQKLSEPSGSSKIACPACNKAFGLDEYLDHVYESDECYKSYLASEKKEMSKL